MTEFGKGGLEDGKENGGHDESEAVHLFKLNEISEGGRKEKGKGEETHGQVVVDAVQEEVEHEEEGSVGEVFLNVEDKAVHCVFEELLSGRAGGRARGDRGEGRATRQLSPARPVKHHQLTVQIKLPKRKQAPVLPQAVPHSVPFTNCWLTERYKMYSVMGTQINGTTYQGVRVNISR